jgi:hypothetical protein
MTEAGPRSAGDWEYALSAGDELVLAHLGSVSPGGPVRARQPHVVVVLAAAVWAEAQRAGLHGPSTSEVRLDAVARGLADGPGELLAAAPAVGGLGGEQRDELLADPAGLGEAASLVGDVLAGHLASGAGTLADHLTRDSRAELLRRLGEA